MDFPFVLPFLVVVVVGGVYDCSSVCLWLVIVVGSYLMSWKLERCVVVVGT